MSSAKDRNEEWYSGKHCHECCKCSCLIEYEWQDDDSCSCDDN